MVKNLLENGYCESLRRRGAEVRRQQFVEGLKAEGRLWKD